MDGCNAHRDHTGQMVCIPCGLQWDVNDPDPPVCGAGHDINVPYKTVQIELPKAQPETGKREYKKIREILDK